MNYRRAVVDRTVVEPLLIFCLTTYHTVWYHHTIRYGMEYGDYMAHISHQDWLVVGLRMLSQEGAAGLTIDALTRQQQVTKGSFYHHFHNYADFKTALLEYWEQEYTRRIVAFSEGEHPADFSSADPDQIFPRFLAILAKESPAVEIAMRAWALEDETVRAFHLCLRLASLPPACPPATLAPASAE